MGVPILKGTMVMIAVGGLLTVGVTPSFAETPNEIQQTVNVVGTGTSVGINHSMIQSGSIRFNVSSTSATTPNGGGSSVSLFQPKAGKTLSRVLHDLRDEFGPPKMAADGTRELTADARFLGLAEVSKGHSEMVTEFLSPGTYYLLDLGGPPPNGVPAVTTLRVRKADPRIEQDSDLRSQVTVQVTSADRFVTQRDWPHKGTYTYKNVSDTLHMGVIVPVKRGTTDAQIQKFFDSGSQQEPSFALNGPGGGNDVTSPGAVLQVSYDLPAGTYVLLCFVADEKTGIPHAVMGMHKVIVLH